MVNRDRAERVAAQALGFIAGDETMLGAFLAQSGAEASDLRARVRDPAFLGFVLDFLLQEDERVIGFAEAQGFPPQELLVIRQGLPGGEEVHWT